MNIPERKLKCAETQGYERLVCRELKAHPNSKGLFMCEENRILEREAKEVSRGIIIKGRLRCIPSGQRKPLRFSGRILN